MLLKEMKIFPFRVNIDRDGEDRARENGARGTLVCPQSFYDFFLSESKYLTRRKYR